MGTGESIQVNGFRFCHDHGDELCHTCLCDYRLTNNIRVEDHLGDMEAFEVEERLPLNAYRLGAVAALHTEESYRCELHKEVDCKSCFAWVEAIRKQAEIAEERGRWLSVQAMDTMQQLVS